MIRRLRALGRAVLDFLTVIAVTVLPGRYRDLNPRLGTPARRSSEIAISGATMPRMTETKHWPRQQIIPPHTWVKLDNGTGWVRQDTDEPRSLTLHEHGTWENTRIFTFSTVDPTTAPDPFDEDDDE
ncbi:hypothetical protein [Amycolatopsis thermoflava]|uniref:hypothetical protein n=1 Tax=Amycolatopsis thermoflava TaxID=84480 RepID=UPI0036491A74